MRAPRLRFATMAAVAAVLMNVDAAVACNEKPQAYMTAMKSDLRNVLGMTRSFGRDYGRWTPDFRELGYKASSGVGPMVIHHSSASGFAASITHPKLPAVTCFVAAGDIPVSSAVPATRRDGEPWCEGPPPKWYERRVSRTTDWFVAMSLLAMALSTAVFLPRRGRRNWPAMGLGLLTALAVLPAAFPTDCRIELSYWLVVGGLAAGLFALAARGRFHGGLA